MKQQPNIANVVYEASPDRTGEALRILERLAVLTDHLTWDFFRSLMYGPSTLSKMRARRGRDRLSSVPDFFAYGLGCLCPKRKCLA